MSQAIPTKPTNATKSKFSSIIPLLFVFPLLEIVQKRFTSVATTYQSRLRVYETTGQNRISA